VRSWSSWIASENYRRISASRLAACPKSKALQAGTPPDSPSPGSGIVLMPSSVLARQADRLGLGEGIERQLAAEMGRARALEPDRDPVGPARPLPTLSGCAAALVGGLLLLWRLAS